MIRRIFATAVPAALVAVGMSLAISEPANAQNCRSTCFSLSPTGVYGVSSGAGRGAGRGVGGPTTTNTNQVYPNNRRGIPGLSLNNIGGEGVGWQLTAKSGRG